MSSPGSITENLAIEDYNSDEEPMPEEEHCWKWRGDPDKTHSDWKIEVVVAAGAAATSAECGGGGGDNEEGSSNGCESSSQETLVSVENTYHVHKYVLGYGLHRSVYFERLFQTADRYAESKSRTSRIELDPLAAKAFPQLLDFVYSSDDNGLAANTENATALHYLGQYFEIRRLRWLARQFWKKDLSLINVDTYYEHAKKFHDGRVLEAAASLCSKNIMKIESTSRIIQISDSNLWIRILDEADNHDATRLHLSSLIAAHCGNIEVDEETFQKLTREGILPRIAFAAAPKLSDLEDKVTTPDDRCKGTHREGEGDLSNLQKRCVKSMAEKWEALDTSDQDTMEFLQRKKPSFLAELLAESLLKSKTAKHDLEQSLSSKCQHLSSCENSLTQANRELSSCENRLTQAERELSSCQNRLNQANRDLLLEQNRAKGLEEKLNRFKPLNSNQLIHETPTARPDDLIDGSPKQLCWRQTHYNESEYDRYSGSLYKTLFCPVYYYE